MASRDALVFIGFGTALVGYALTYSGVSQLNPCITPTGEPMTTLDALIPGRAGTGTKPVAPPSARAKAPPRPASRPRRPTRPVARRPAPRRRPATRRTR